MAGKSEVKRITVAVDTSPGSLASMGIAVDLAARMRARLETLFVEDDSLLRLAGLPFATELDRSSGETRALSESGLTDALQIQARRLRKMMHTFGEQRRIPTSLRIVRGNYIAEAVQAEADVMFLYTSTRVSMGTPGRHAGFGGIQPSSRYAAPICVYCPAGRVLRRPVSLAADLAAILDTEVVVLLTGKQMPAAPERGGRVHYRTAGKDIEQTAAYIAAAGCALLVLPWRGARAFMLNNKVLEAVHCPIALVA